MDNLETMGDQAVAMHEVYLSLRQAGFDEHQALAVMLSKPCCAEWCKHEGK